MLKLLFGLVLGLVLLGQMGGKRAEASGQQQTVPTRTPTPDPTSTEQPPEPTEPAGADPPTATPSPTRAATSTPTSSSVGEASPTPSAGTAAATTEILDCESPALAIALQDIDVLDRPQEDGTVIGTLSFQDSRPLLGRTFDAQWWLLEYAPDMVGWVNQQQIQLQGCVDLLDVLSEAGPAENQSGSVQSPAATSASEELEEQTPAPTEVSLNDQRAVVDLVGTPVSQNSSAETAQSALTDTESSSPTAQVEENALSGLSWMLVLGLLLLAAGGALLLVNRFLHRE